MTRSRTRAGDARCGDTEAAKLIQGNLDQRPAGDLEQSFILPHARAAASGKHKPLDADIERGWPVFRR